MPWNASLSIEWLIWVSRISIHFALKPNPNSEAIVHEIMSTVVQFVVSPLRKLLVDEGREGPPAEARNVIVIHIKHRSILTLIGL